MTMPTKKETMVACICFFSDHFFQGPRYVCINPWWWGCRLKKKLWLPGSFFSIHYYSRTKLCLPVFLTMKIATKKETMLACILNGDDADPKRNYGCLYRGHLAICKVHTTQWLGQSCLEGSSWWWWCRYQWCRKWTFVDVQCKTFSSFLFSFLFVHILFQSEVSVGLIRGKTVSHFWWENFLTRINAAMCPKRMIMWQ